MWDRCFFGVLASFAVALIVLGFHPGGVTSLSGVEEPDSSGPKPTQIVLLGTAHFTGVAPDILSEKRQEELEVVAKRIADWEPDQYFVECPFGHQTALDSVYSVYRGGNYDLSDPGGLVGRGEIYQLGFRTAARAELNGVECVDAKTSVPYDRAQEVAEEHNPELLESYRQYSDTTFDRGSLFADHTIREALLTLNTEQKLWETYKKYLYYYARMGSFDQSGAKVRREGDLEGSTFALRFELAERHKKEVREAIRNAGGEVASTPDQDTDYVVLMEPGAGGNPESDVDADTISLGGLGSFIADNTSNAWIGFPDHHIGADVLAQRYKRDLRIYANVWNALAEGDERAVLMIGQAHVWNLRKLFRDNPDFEVVSVREVL